MNEHVPHHTRSRASRKTTLNIQVAHAEHAQILIDFLDKLRTELWSVHGTAIERQRHEEACRDAQTDTQQSLELDEPPF